MTMQDILTPAQIVVNQQPMHDILALVQILTCGYLLHQIIPSKLLTKYPGHILYFRVLVLGLIWKISIEFGWSRISHLVSESFNIIYHFEDYIALIIAFCLRILDRSLSPARTMLISVIAFCSQIIDRDWSRRITEKNNEWIKKEGKRKVAGYAFEEFLMDATYRDFQILATTTNNKAYIGWVTTFNPDDKIEWLSILPLFSGYRKEDTKEIVFNVDYFEYYEQEDYEELLVILSIDKVTSIQKFDHAFFDFNKRAKIIPASSAV